MQGSYLVIRDIGPGGSEEDPYGGIVVLEHTKGRVLYPHGRIDFQKLRDRPSPRHLRSYFLT